MKIIHTADWHLGNTFHGFTRSAEHAHFLDWLQATLRREQPDALIVAGDVFDTSNPPAAAQRMFYDFLVAATREQPRLQVVIIAGNHDSAARLEAPAELLRAHNVYVRGLIPYDPERATPRYADLILPLYAGASDEAQVVCFALPYLRPSDYAAGLTPAQGIATYLAEMQRALRKSPFSALPVVTAAHFYAAGATLAASEHSERIVVGGQDVVEASAAECGAVYTALGHLHRAQQVLGARSEMRYAGSPIPLSFTEKSYARGVRIVTIDPEAGTAQSTHCPYTPLCSLLSLPESGSATPKDVLRLIDALPARRKGDDEATYPYLELTVREAQPEPELVRDITEALAEKAVRLCRVTRSAGTPAAEGHDAAAAPRPLTQVSPLDLANEIAQARFGERLSEPLATRFNQALQDALQADEEGEERQEA